MTLITGNQIGAMLADFRISRLKTMGGFKEGTQSAALIKTMSLRLCKMRSLRLMVLKLLIRLQDLNGSAKS